MSIADVPGPHGYHHCLVRAGIVGFAASGKKTLFSLLTQVAQVGFAAGAKRGVLAVPDERLETLTRLHESKKTTPATVEVVLIPALRRGASGQTENLAALREVDAIVHAVRAFEDPTVPSPFDSVDAGRDAANLELELLLADLAVLEKRIKRLDADRARGKPEAVRGERDLLDRARQAVEGEVPVREALSAEDRKRLGGYGLMSAKPQLLVVNAGDTEAARDPASWPGLDEISRRPETRLAAVSARIEAEIAELPEEDAAEFRRDIGVEAGAAERIVRAIFELMDRATFYTAGDTESRAWLIRRNTRAQEAAGEIHTDMERGFIRAEVVSFDKLVDCGSWDGARKAGALRLEGKDYPVQDGDVLVIRFHVG